MSSETVVLLPYPPSTNSLWRYTNRGVFRTSKYVNYINDCKAVGQCQEIPFDTPVRMEILACPPDRRKRDLDNLAKPLCDVSMHIGLIEDDSLIWELRMKWDRLNVTNGVLLIVTPLTVLAVEEAARSSGQKAG